MNCVFCEIIKKNIPSQIISEDEGFLAILDVNPINPGHMLLIPKQHIDYIFDMDDVAYTKLLLKAKQVSKFMKTKVVAKRIGMVVEGFGVPHVHIHLVPINSGNELNPEKAKKATEEELKNVKEKIYKIKK